MAGTPEAGTIEADRGPKVETSCDVRDVRPPGSPRGGDPRAGRHRGRRDEAELRVRFAAGEPGSVAEVYRTYGRLVYMVSYRMLGDVGLARDATERTFVVAWRLAASFNPSRTLGPWLATIADRTAKDIEHRNRQRHEQAHPVEPVRTAPAQATLTSSADQVNDVWLIRRALDALSGQDRELIRLRHAQQLTRDEISDRLAIPPRSVESRSTRAHRRLADLLTHLRASRAADDCFGAPWSASSERRDPARYRHTVSPWLHPR